MVQTSDGSPESREIRVFLSSTFRDFMEERELLAKQVFPELNRRGRERGVVLWLHSSMADGIESDWMRWNLTLLNDAYRLLSNIKLAAWVVSSAPCVMRSQISGDSK